MNKWLPKKDPWLPPDYDEQVIMAIRALAAGVANTGQQQTAWAYLMYVTGASEEFADLSFRPGVDGQRSTDFAEGKRFVGQMVRKLLRPELTPRDATERPLSRREIAQRVRRARERNGQ